MKKLWLKDINFLKKRAKNSQMDEEILRLLHQIEASKVENKDYYLTDLDRSETDLMEDFLTDLRKWYWRRWRSKSDRTLH